MLILTPRSSSMFRTSYFLYPSICPLTRTSASLYSKYSFRIASAGRLDRSFATCMTCSTRIVPSLHFGPVQLDYGISRIFSSSLLLERALLRAYPARIRPCGAAADQRPDLPALHL